MLSHEMCRCCCGCEEYLGPRRLMTALNASADVGGPRCTGCELANHFDAARRASDQVRLHLLADRERAINSWVAIRMSDGGSDGILYDWKRQAVRHQLHEYQCCYVKITPDGMSPRVAEAFLRFHRGLYDHGFRLADPDKDLEVVMPNRQELLF